VPKAPKVQICPKTFAHDCRFLVNISLHHRVIADRTVVGSRDVKFAGLFKITLSRGDSQVYDNCNSLKKATFSYREGRFYEVTFHC